MTCHVQHIACRSCPDALGLEPEANVAEASRLIRRAVADGAEFVATPEMTNVIEPRRSVLWEKVWDEAADLSVAALATVAREFGTGCRPDRWRCGQAISGQSLAALCAGWEDRARYDKVHLFDVALPNGESYHDREAMMAGPGQSPSISGR